MKKILTITLIMFFISEISAQVGEKFKYEMDEFGNYNVTSVFHQTKITGKIGYVVIKDQKYIEELFTNVIKKNITDEKIKKLSIGTAALLYINSNGEIIYCSFVINSADVNILNEDELYNIYIEFKNLKIDTSKVYISAESIPPYEKECDYALLVVSFVPPEYRTRFLKK
jgi:hypothetical protein